MKNVFIIPIITTILLVGCSNESGTIQVDTTKVVTTSDSLDGWIGNYKYQETPIEANADYSMVMIWSLSVIKENNDYKGIIEVNGQQTYLKLQTSIKGDSNSIALCYHNKLDGMEDDFTPGDTLFTLTKTKEGFKTIWKRLEPKLLEIEPKECYCFIQNPKQ